MIPQKADNHPQLFNTSLETILNPEHPLYKLANAIDWSSIEAELAGCYSSDMGRPGNATRLMVGLHYLKYTYNESDESLVQRWVENPYWQYFCGYEYMQHEFPIHPTSMVKWRKRVGSERMSVLLKETLATAKRAKLIKDSHTNKVIVDTTVQEKAIAYPTDAKLYCKSIRRLAKLARQRGISLRQSYVRVSKRIYFLQSRYARAKQYRRSARQTKKLRTYLGRLIRDIERKATDLALDEELLTILSRAKRIHSQQRQDKGKLYSLDSPEVECISKGKAHKRYEFGCKVSLSVTAKGNWITSILAFHGNPFDGHTLNETLLRSESMTGVRVKEVYLDRGYRGHNYLGDAEVYMKTNRLKALTQTVKRKLKRRNAIEPTIGHLKSDNRMGRNFLKGIEGDRINALLSAVGYNMRKLIAAYLYALRKLSCFLQNNSITLMCIFNSEQIALTN